jgi:hypothetical protein
MTVIVSAAALFCPAFLEWKEKSLSQNAIKYTHSMRSVVCSSESGLAVKAGEDSATALVTVRVQLLFGQDISTVLNELEKAHWHRGGLRLTSQEKETIVVSANASQCSGW